MTVNGGFKSIVQLMMSIGMVHAKGEAQAVKDIFRQRRIVIFAVTMVTRMTKPFTFDNIYWAADGYEREGNHGLAGRLFLWLAHNFDNTRWMFIRAANCFIKVEPWRALRLILTVNLHHATVSSYLIEARAMREVGCIDRAIKAYTNARQEIEK